MCASVLVLYGSLRGQTYMYLGPRIRDMYSRVTCDNINLISRSNNAYVCQLLTFEEKPRYGTRAIVTIASDCLYSSKHFALISPPPTYYACAVPHYLRQFVQSATVDLVDFFSGLDSSDNFHDARVDPFEPSRVWITSTPTAKVVGPLSCFGTTVRRYQ